jgi:hypothetical protein
MKYGCCGEYDEHAENCILKEFNSLKVENVMLRGALEKIMAIDPVTYDGKLAWQYKQIARKALKGSAE